MDKHLVTNGNLSYKLNRTFTIQNELITALKAHGCPSCLQLLREIIKKYSDSSLEATNQKLISMGDEPFDTSYRAKQ